MIFTFYNPIAVVNLMKVPLDSVLRLAKWIGAPLPRRERYPNDRAYQYRVACAVNRQVKRHPKVCPQGGSGAVPVS